MWLISWRRRREEYKFEYIDEVLIMDHRYDACQVWGNVQWLALYPSTPLFLLFLLLFRLRLWCRQLINIRFPVAPLAHPLPRSSPALEIPESLC